MSQPSDPEPEPYRNMSRRQLIDWIQSLTIESARHRRGKRCWKNYAKELEPDVYLEVQHPCWSCNSNSSSANASAGVR